MSIGRGVAALVLIAAMTIATACSTLLGADATPVPGAAATLTRSQRTPIPTPLRTPVASPSASAVVPRAGAATSPVPSPAGTDQALSDDEVAQIQRRMQQVVANPSLPGIEGLLLDHVSLSTAEGGSVLDSAQASAWLRDHAADGIRVTSVARGTLTVMLDVVTEGWPARDPVEQGRVTFSLRRYDASGRPDEENGDWKIDVIGAE